MKRLVLLLIIGGLVVSCASLPELHKAAGPEPSKINRVCPELYPVGKWQLLHTIEAELPGGNKGFLMGVTRVSSRERSARSVIMTIEGFVVFDAHDDGTVRVERAVAPFDNEAFAQGVMADIRLIFFNPLTHEIKTGTLADGTAICRHYLGDDSVIDTVQLDNDLWEIRLYDPQKRLKRIATCLNTKNRSKEAPMGIVDKIELTALGTPGYKLILDLVEAIPLEAGESTQHKSE